MTTLADKINAALGEKPSHGTVIRWETSAGYLYMAVAIEQANGRLRWYSSSRGNPYVPQTMTSARLLGILGQTEVVSVGVTNDFDLVE